MLSGDLNCCESTKSKGISDCFWQQQACQKEMDKIDFAATWFGWWIRKLKEATYKKIHIQILIQFPPGFVETADLRYRCAISQDPWLSLPLSTSFVRANIRLIIINFFHLFTLSRQYMALQKDDPFQQACFQNVAPSPVKLFCMPGIAGMLAQRSVLG